MPQVTIALLLAISAFAEFAVEFERQQLTPEFYSEGANVGDFNQDGKLDVVAGPYWYAGPAFTERHAYYQPQAFDPHGYSRHFFSFVDDWNGDGWDDVLVVGFPGQQALLYLNPQRSDELWSGTQVVQQVGNESPWYTDITGDGKAELVCMQDNRFGYASPGADPSKPWTFRAVHEDQKGGHWHGLGVGDVNRDGRLDIICKSGWFAQPEGDGHWPLRAANFGNGGAQMHAYDVDGDGDNDVISSIQAHGYGLAWFEQTPAGFTEHRFVGDRPEHNRYGIVFSQIHAVDLIDMDGDGLKDIVTGKRFWAHGPKGDAEPSAPCVLYWFRLQRGDDGVDFVPQLIDDDSGIGTQVLARDIDGDDLPDVLVGCKRGLYVHRQRRHEISAAEFAKRQPIPRSQPAPAPRIPLVVEAEPKTPEEQRLRFQLPPGFEIQLVAAEPDIGQAINLNFDARGRLWVSHTLEYPFPAKDNPRDRVSIFSEFDTSGRPARIEHLQPGLDIPIGVLPSVDGDSVIIHDVGRTVSYPERKVLFEGFGYKDTHGMNNSFTRGLDGWIYALHGFANGSKVRRPGDDTVLLAMKSGNSYRFREDGSAIEQVTWGQTNPFGLAIDPWGNLYSADCHSMPVYMLIHGAHYPGLGKKASPIGHAPKMIDHNHGSTGIAGIAWYHDDHFPAGYKDTLFIGNPVNGIVHWDRLRWKGASPSVDTQADFIRCDDPWFRPVDIKMGPGGALYIADFYNCIIGHYEVKLDHEKRDRRHGRVWRVVYSGETPAAPDLTKADPIAALAHPNLRVQRLAANLLVANSAPAASLEPVLRQGSVAGQVNALWVLARIGGLGDEQEQLALAAPARVRAHLARAYAILDEPNPDRLILLLGDLNHQVRRAAAETMRTRPNPRFVESLLRILSDIHNEDDHLAHTLRLALAAHIQAENDIAQLRKVRIPQSSWPELITIVIASEEPEGANFLLDALANGQVTAQQLQPALGDLAAHTDLARIDSLRSVVDPQPSQQDKFSAFELLLKGAEADSATLKAWAIDLIAPVLAVDPAPASSWTFSDGTNSFGRRSRNCEDGTKADFFDSIVGGESHTGRMRSPAFPLPASFSFWMCGHNGHPNSNPRRTTTYARCS